MMFKSLLVAAACVASAIAQANLAFTGFPSAQQPVGQPVELKWEGGNGSPVTITLRQGDPNNLKDVAVLTSSATGNSYTWIPSSSLASGGDYALQISQSGGTPNYYGPFTLTGGSLSASGSASITSSASSVISSASSALSSASSLLSSITSNSTSTASSNSTSLSSRPTLSSTASSTRSASSSGSSASSTGGATGSNGAAGLSSPIALVFGAVAAMLYLN